LGNPPPPKPQKPTQRHGPPKTTNSQWLEMGSATNPGLSGGAVWGRNEHRRRSKEGGQQPEHQNAGSMGKHAGGTERGAKKKKKEIVKIRWKRGNITLKHESKAKRKIEFGQGAVMSKLF